jgi:hypothetical protein
MAGRRDDAARRDLTDSACDPTSRAYHAWLDSQRVFFRIARNTT